jgi:hypothetical protein
MSNQAEQKRKEKEEQESNEPSSLPCPSYPFQKRKSCLKKWLLRWEERIFDPRLPLPRLSSLLI